ncbi:helix-turn-helix domain-containing protein [Nocardia sp. CA-084685]|uniref:helix-turn-helix domain-containing protein n=1 Tax=Nocardia sp. CA-084685 TaxID=3239970 RepID=UPI003D989A53
MSIDRARASDDSERPQQISYSVAQAHTATGLSECTLRQLVREGKIAARYYGTKILIDAESLRSYMNPYQANAKLIETAPPTDSRHSNRAPPSSDKAAVSNPTFVEHERRY